MTETIEANFIGEWHGLYRTIPVEYVTPQGFNYTLFVKLEDATDANRQPLKVEASHQGPLSEVEDLRRRRNRCWSGPFVLHYRVRRTA